MITVLLVDDQPLLRAGFRMILDAQPDLTVLGEAGDGAAAIRDAARLRPDVILMDVRMPGVDGVEATRRILATQPNTRIIILTTFDLDEYAYAGLQAGASGFLLKDVTPPELLTAIRAVAHGDAVIAPSTTRRLLDHLSGQLTPPPAIRLEALTDRERDVLLLIARGLTNAEIAAALHLAEATVKTHIGRILTKLDLRDRVHAVILAYQTGLITSHHRNE